MFKRGEVETSGFRYFDYIVAPLNMTTRPSITN